MTRHELHLLLVAPEIVVVDLADAALESLRRALVVQHPGLDASPATNEPAAQRAARAVLPPIQSLRRALRRYRRAVERLARDLRRDDLPF